MTAALSACHASASGAPQSCANAGAVWEGDIPTAWWLLLQAASTVTPSDFDLKSLDQTQRADPPRCVAPHASDEIVVCGRTDGSRFRIRDLPNPYIEKQVRAEVGLGGGAIGNMHADEVVRSDGIPDKRIMVTVKVPF